MKPCGLACLLTVALVPVGCATTRGETGAAAAIYPGELTPPDAHPGEFVRRQKLTARYRGQERSFEAVLQKQGDALTLIGLTPFGSKAFVLEQRGLEVTFTPYLAGDLPFPPRFILQDVHRVYFAGLGEGPRADGEHVAEAHGERIREVWGAGRLLSREYTRLSADPPGTISIVYRGGMACCSSPRQIELENGWLGYHLSIQTVSEQAL